MSATIDVAMLQFRHEENCARAGSLQIESLALKFNAGLKRESCSVY
jgi:hypothetical protein